MPFTIAHPAAVLPLRRYCPRFLSFPVLVIGSLVPDVAYVFGKADVDEFSHHLVGSVGFCLPVGLMILWLFHGLRRPAVRVLPERLRRILQPLCQRPLASPPVVVVSLLIGSWTHIFLDSLTHRDGWLVEHLPVLQIAVASIGTQTLRVHLVVWYAATFVGVVWLLMAFQHWQDRACGRPAPAAAAVTWGNAVVVGALVLPIASLHHLANPPLAFRVVAVLAFLAATGLVARVGWQTGKYK